VNCLTQEQYRNWASSTRTLRPRNVSGLRVERERQCPFEARRDSKQEKRMT